MKTALLVPKFPGWLTDDLLVIGAEGEDDSSNPPAGDDPKGGQDDTGGNPDDSKGGSEDDDDDDDGDEPDDYAELKAALRKERRNAKALERENRRFKTAQEEAALKDATELEKAQAKLTKAEERAQRLAAGLLKRDIDAAIRREAEKAGFIDVDDALAGVDRDQIKATQDADDPTDIEIDLKTIVTQVKGLATRKPHFIKQGTTDGQPSGSQFGGSKPQKKSTEDELRAHYPAL